MDYYRNVTDKLVIMLNNLTLKCVFPTVFFKYFFVRLSLIFFLKTLEVYIQIYFNNIYSTFWFVFYFYQNLFNIFLFSTILNVIIK